MKIQVNNISYTLVAIVVEPVQVTKANIIGVQASGMELKTVVYCYDRNRAPHKFLVDQIERYD